MGTPRRGQNRFDLHSNWKIPMIESVQDQPWKFSDFGLIYRRNIACYNVYAYSYQLPIFMKNFINIGNKHVSQEQNF